ncbi:Alpha/Beta hydrolase protein [Pisolithus croceorrhizus]|nr:Alpha/Beta hydrolase protein [Pisolithus croceorrhizus]
MAGRKSTKLYIPQPADNCTLVGTLEQLEPDKPANGKRVALILHGTMGHKDYLFQKRLAMRLPLDSFRFDFRGSHESGGQWKYGGFAEDVQDLVTVVAFLRDNYGYEIDMVVGHSRGSVVGMHWLCTSEEGKRVTAVVNVSGRYRMHRIYDQMCNYKEAFDTMGYYEWKVSVARKQVLQRVYPKDLEEFASWDTGIVWDNFPPTINVLTVHGLADGVVPVYDAVIYARAFGSRAPGTHVLHLMEDADHNFTGRQDEVVDVILEWLEGHHSGALVTGVLRTGIRGRL